MQHDSHVLDHDHALVEILKYSNRADWLRGRRSFITSTDVAPLAKIGRFGSPLSIFAEKTKEASEADAKDDSEPRMMLGRIFQRDIGVAYSALRLKEEGVAYLIESVPDYTLYVHARNKDHATSLDFLQRRDDGTRRVPLETKMTTAYVDEPYDDWLAQVQWQMYVTGSPTATIAALCGGDDLRWWDIERDDEVIGDLRKIADDFVSQHVMPGVPPASDGSEPSRRAMRKLYAVSDGSEVALEIADLATVTEIMALRERAAEMLKEEAVMVDALKQKMGAAEVAYLPNGGKITWKSFPKAGYTVQPSMQRPFKIDPHPPAEKKRKK